jgi:hypothetical protein
MPGEMPQYHLNMLRTPKREILEACEASKFEVPLPNLITQGVSSRQDGVIDAVLIGLMITPCFRIAATAACSMRQY